MNHGWICPTCGKALAPWVPSCEHFEYDAEKFKKEFRDGLHSVFGKEQRTEVYEYGWDNPREWPREWLKCFRPLPGETVGQACDRLKAR